MFKNLSLELKIRILTSITITLNVITTFMFNMLVYYSNSGFDYRLNVISLTVGFVSLFVFFKKYPLKPEYHKHPFILGFFTSVFLVIYSITLIILDYYF